MPEPRLDLKSRFLGCLVGCAVGDALGAPFEGYWEHQLPGRKALLRGFAEVEGYPRGQYTDDTQLTLATIESIVRLRDLAPADIARSIASLWKLKPEFSRPIITPFIVPTVLAALWVVLEHQTSWPRAVSEAIHLGGDVDTLGAIVGALSGVRLGASAIPSHLASGVLESDRIKILASQYYEVVTQRSAARTR
jgi:ADP-ribosylglycohydrolase